MDSDLQMVEFTALDRCDGCGAQAYHRAQREGNSDLLFCIHHMKAGRTKLLDQGWTIIDDFDSLEILYGDQTAIPV